MITARQDVGTSLYQYSTSHYKAQNILMKK